MRIAMSGIFEKKKQKCGGAYEEGCYMFVLITPSAWTVEVNKVWEVSAPLRNPAFR